ncbi:LemA family protein [Gordonia sp. CPCC 205333]|uniref:LemA family protein n=1 Tax=Gordonia sp. CPCC 205333 TaxID=3140790 RepID=UPI003AF3FF70
MDGAAVTLIAMGVIIAALVILGMVAFGKLHAADMAATEAAVALDEARSRRADLVSGLADVTKEHAPQERSVFDDAVTAHAGSDDAAITQALNDILQLADNYPDLKTSSSFSQLEEHLSDSTNELAHARQHYNDTARHLNQLVATVPWMFFSGFAGITSRDLVEF